MTIKIIKVLMQRLRNPARADIADNEAEQMYAFSISARLAALPPDFESQVPPAIAQLISEAKTLHPEMSAGACERHAAGKSPAIWNSGF